MRRDVDQTFTLLVESYSNIRYFQCLVNCTWDHHLTPLLPNAANMRRSAKILILILEEIIKKNSYERRDCESVDEKSLS